RSDPENQEQRENNAATAKEMKKRVARVEPAKCRQQSVRVSPKLCASCRQELIQGRHPVAADQSIHLHPERHESDQIRQAERAQKPAPRPEESRRPHASSPEYPSNGRAETAMPSDEPVSGFRNCRESRDVIVTPCQPFSRRPITQRAIHGFRGEKDFAVCFDESHRALKVTARNFREPICDILIGGIINLIPSNFSPALNPPPAKITFAVPDQERSGEWIGNAQ